MKKILVIANYKKSIGGISGQVEILLEKFNSNEITSELFNTNLSNIKRIFLPIKLFFKISGFDTLHIHGCSGLGFFPIVIGVLVGRTRQKKIIITYHGGGLKKFINSYSTFVKYFLNKADIVTVPSFYLINILTNNKIDAIHLPNVIREDNVVFKKRLQIDPKLIVTRSLEKVYNIPLAIKAFVEIRKKYIGAELFIVGDGSLNMELEKLVKEFNVEGVIFVGRVENSEIGKVLNRADIYINPTTADNMPLSLFEAFACGLPIISTNVGGLPDFIIDSENGFLIDSNDVKALVTKIEYILLNQEKIKPIIENGFRTYKKYTWGQLRSNYIQLYS